MGRAVGIARLDLAGEGLHSERLLFSDLRALLKG